MARHLQEGDSLEMVFMPMVFSDEKQHKELQKDLMPEKGGPAGMIFEYLSEAGPRSCNGLPGFFSMRIVTAKEMPDFIKFHDEYKSMKNQFIAK